MSGLREQLRAARAGHEAARYPGDLAAEVLGRVQPRSRRWFVGGGIGAGLAAAAAAVVLMMLPGRRPIAPGVIGSDVPQAAVAQFIPPAMPEMPAGLPLVLPEAQEFGAIPGSPGLPLFDETL